MNIKRNSEQGHGQSASNPSDSNQLPPVSTPAEPADRQPQTLRQRLIRPRVLSAIVGLIIASFAAGAGLAAVLAVIPLGSHASTQLSRSRDPLGDLPATLTRPITILLLGIDNSGHPHTTDHYPSEEALAGNSDTMLLVRLVPSTHQINVLSIPRDTQVQMPNYGTDKINDANMRGGAKLAAQVVSQSLQGISIDRYIRVDTEGLIHLVDALGGVEITIPKAMNYDDQTQHLHIHFTAGRQRLTGQHLEEYVRFRHDELGDIGRVQRQQDALRALLQTLLQPQSLVKIPDVIHVAQTNIDTDLSLNDMLAVGRFLVTADLHHINLVMLPGRFSRPDEATASYWIANPKATELILARYFDLPPLTASSPSPQSDLSGGSSNTGLDSKSINLDTGELSASPMQEIAPSQVRVAVENATHQPNAARRVVALLRQSGFTQAYVSEHDVDSNGDGTTILAQQGDPELANQVQQVLGLGQVEIASTGDIWSDVTVVVGDDLATRLDQPTPSPSP